MNDLAAAIRRIALMLVPGKSDLVWKSTMLEAISHGAETFLHALWKSQALFAIERHDFHQYKVPKRALAAEHLPWIFRLRRFPMGAE